VGEGRGHPRKERSVARTMHAKGRGGRLGRQTINTPGDPKKEVEGRK